MINKDRIVPVQKIDLLTLYGTVLSVASVSYGVISSDVEGDFSVTGTGDAGVKLANQPVKSLDFASGVTAGTVYFVAAYDYEGFKVAGSAATIADASAEVKADGASLYKAVLSGGEITFTAVSPVL